MAEPVDREHDRQADGRLGRRDGDDEDREQLPRQVQRRIDRLHVAGERHHHDVDGVQHQLDREQHADRVAPRERAEHPDGEQDRR